MNQDYVEIEDDFGSYKVYNNEVPDTLLSTKPIELQEVSFFQDGKGHRSAYSNRPTISFDFAYNKKTSLIKAKFHKHDYFELLLVASGKLEMQIESNLCDFQKWDVCILNRSTKHAEHFEANGRFFYLVLSPDFLLNWPKEEGFNIMRTPLYTKFFNKGLRDTLLQNKDFITARFTNRTEPSPLLNILEEMRKEFQNKSPGYQLFIRGLVCRFLWVLADTTYYQTDYIDLGLDDGFSLALSTKQILETMKRRVSKTELSERLNYNPEYINRVFKKHYGQTISEYSRSLNMQQAASLLCQTDIAIHKLCKQLGYTNRTHFYDIFKQEYGCSPSEYREQHKSTNNLF